jgi:hypothetical protein
MVKLELRLNLFSLRRMTAQHGCVYLKFLKREKDIRLIFSASDNPQEKRFVLYKYR